MRSAGKVDEAAFFEDESLIISPFLANFVAIKALTIHAHGEMS